MIITFKVYILDYILHICYLYIINISESISEWLLIIREEDGSLSDGGQFTSSL